MPAPERHALRAVLPAWLLAVFCLCLAPTAADAAGSVSEQSIKAAYLYKFAAYVDWPEGVLDDPATPLTIGVLGADTLADELESITAQRTVAGRSIVVRRIGSRDTLEGVNILFVSESGMDEFERLAPAAREHSALVVTEAGDGLDLGSVINFRPVDRRIRFEVSLESADKSRLRLSSRLLAVAENVRPRMR
jgi:hypothetical protein